jgi:methyl-accepting chemotaxis protein
VTQQNSALVEEATATAKTLDQQAQVMRERVDFFRLEDGQPIQGKVAHTVVPLRQQAVEGAPKRAVGGRGHGALAKAAGAQAGWKEF